MKRIGSRCSRLVVAGLTGLVAALPPAPAGAAPTWEFAVVARSGLDSLSDPALDRDPVTGAWQVAFGAGEIPSLSLTAGIYRSVLGGTPTLLATQGDLMPGLNPAGNRFCFSSRCGVGAPERVSLSQGVVAFKGQNDTNSGASSVKGIYVLNGTSGSRIADTSMTMPGASVEFGGFESPSLSHGFVVFKGIGAGDFSGIYGDTTKSGGLTRLVDLKTRPPGDLNLDTFSEFGNFPSVSPAWTGTGSDTLKVAFAASGFSGTGKVNGIYFQVGFVDPVYRLMDVRGPDPQPALLSPGIDFFSSAVFSIAHPGTADWLEGIYMGRHGGFMGKTGPEVVADVETTVPGGTGTFTSFGPYPANDAQIAANPSILILDRWVAFVGTSGAPPSRPQSGLYLLHDWTYPQQQRTLEKVIDEAGLLKLLAPWLGSVGSPDPPIVDITLFHQAVKEGAIAFRVSAHGGIPAPSDFIIVARKTTPTLLLKPDADTYIRADLEVRKNDNYGLQDYIEVGNGREGGTPADRMQALLHFNLDVLPVLDLTSAALEASVHSYDNGTASSVYTVDAHAITGAWTGAKPAGEGNGFEGLRPPGAPSGLTDPDTAYGVAWDKTADFPKGENNTSKPSFDPAVLSTQQIAQLTHVTGDRFQWDVTALANGWLRKQVPNHGVLLSDATTEASFRGVRLGSREGEVYGLPLAVQGPRLALKWTVGVMAGDLTGNSCVDRDDLALLMAVIRGQAIAGDSLTPRLDLNGDGKVDIADARKLATMFTKPGGAPCL